MKQIAATLALALIASLTLVSGVIHGRMSHRWGPTRDAMQAGKKLKSFPDQFGDWRLEASDEMQRDVIQMLQCNAYFSRAYVNRKNGATVRVAVILGPPGQISVHTPEICYSSRDFSIINKRKRVAIGNASPGQDEFWHLDFQRNNSLKQNQLAVYYAWSTGGRWVASESPRYEFAAAPYLYKIQLAAHLPPQMDAKTKDACYEFLKDFVPVARQYLIEGAGQ